MTYGFQKRRLTSVMSLQTDRRPTLTAFFKYVVAGGLGFIIDYSVLTVCYLLFAWHYLISSALGFIAGLVFVYISSNKWVFNQRRLKENVVVEFLVFALIGLAGLALTVLSMWILVDLLNWYPLIAKLMTTALVLLWNFGARKIVLYS